MNTRGLHYGVLAVAMVLGNAMAASLQKVPLPDSAASSPLLAIDQDRTSVVNRIVAEWGDALVSVGLSSSQLRDVLLHLRADHLLAASVAGNLEGLRNVIANAITSSVPVANGLLHTKALGDTGDDLVYTPVTPCRLVETRGSFPAVYQGNGTPAHNPVPFATNEIRNYTLLGANAVCLSQLPAGLNLSAVQVQVFGIPVGGSSGDIEMSSQGSSFGSTATLIYLGSIPFTSASATVRANLANNQIGVQVRGGGAHVAIDVVGYFKAPGGVGVSELSASLADLTARVARLEGQITAADLVGTYRISGKQMELHGGAGSTAVSSYVFQGTIQLAANGTFTITTSPDNGNTLRLYTSPPSTVDFVGAGGGSGVGTWSYSNGQVTLDGLLMLDVAAAGKVLVGVSFGHDDRTDVLLVLSRL